MAAIYTAGMKLLPCERLTLGTADPPDVVAARVRSAVAAGRLFLRRPAQPFRGTVTGRHFKIVRAQGLFERDSSEPVIVGDILPVPEGTEVRIRMRPRILDFVAPFFWLCIFALWMPAGTWENRKAVFVALAFVGALYGFRVVWFWVRAKRTRTLLCERFGCREVEPRNRLVRSS